jgi:hypothetical protein
MAEREGMTVTLGPHEYRVVPQRLGRIERKLTAVLSAFGSGDAEEAAGVDPELLHEALAVFIPDVMPLWEFRGRMSADDDGSAVYEPERDHSPTVPEIISAIEAIFTVNGGDRLARFFGKFVDAKVLETFITSQLASWASEGSQNRLPTNGGSPQTISTMPAPTSPDRPAPVGKIPLDPASPPSAS